MSFKVFRNNVWDLAQRLKVFRTTATGAPTTDWYLAKKISAWRGPDPGGFWQVVYPDPPDNVSTPFVTGTPVPGFTVSLSNYFFWDFSDYRSPDTVAYQWQSAPTLGGTYSNISSATGLSYTVQDTDIGRFLRCLITGTNERASTAVPSASIILPVPNPYYTFSFGVSLGVNANAFIMLDPDSNGNFPSATAFDLLTARILRYFSGQFRHYEVWYKSDLTTFRIYHQMWRDDIPENQRPSTPNIEMEIVFTNNSNIVDVFVVNPVTTSYIETYTAWQSGGYQIKTHPSASYAANTRFRVTMNPLTAVAAASAAPSTTAPSIFNGWIPVANPVDLTNGTLVFTGGGTSSSPALSPSAFTKSNMFYPSTPTVSTPVYATATTATVSWSGSTANGYWVRASADGVDDFSAFTTGTSITMSGLTSGRAYSVTVSPISRATYDGQYGFPGSVSYTHQSVPSAVKNVTVTNPRQAAVSAGSSGSLITWNIAWGAPDVGTPITRYEFDFDLDDTGGSFAFDNIWTSNGTSTSSDISIFSGSKCGVRVRAVNGAGAGPYVEVVLNSSPSTPGTPAFSNPTINATNAQATINWTAADARGGSDLSYRVYRGQNDANVATDRSGLIANTSFTDNIAGSATGYYYRVVPQNTLAAGNVNLSAIGLRSAVSSELAVTQPTVNVLPIVSSNAREVLVIFSGNIGSGNTPNYSVFRGQNTNPQTSIGSVAGGTTNTNNQLLSVLDAGNFALNTTYYYKVSMTNSINTVEALGSITTPTGAAPGAPGTPGGSANNTNNNVNISWSASNANGGGTVSYTVFRGQGTSAGTEVGSTTNTQFQDSYANPPVSGAFRYRVVPQTPWGGTGTQSGLSANIPAS